MKYLCLVYLEEAKLRAVPDRECQACGDGFRDSGVLVAAEALQPVATATTVRVRNGKASITDGPFAETKEQLAGFYLLEARDLNEAIQMASRIPPAREGSIEVRPVRQLDVDGVGTSSQFPVASSLVRLASLAVGLFPAAWSQSHDSHLSRRLRRGNTTTRRRRRHDAPRNDEAHGQPHEEHKAHQDAQRQQATKIDWASSSCSTFLVSRFGYQRLSPAGGAPAGRPALQE